MQRYCPHCKNELPEDASFCLCCFSRLIESESEPEPSASRRVTATLRITGLSVALCLFSVLGGSDIYMNHPPLTGVVPPSPALNTSDASHNKPPYKTLPPASLTASAAVTPSSLAQTHLPRLPRRLLKAISQVICLRLLSTRLPLNLLRHRQKRRRFPPHPIYNRLLRIMYKSAIWSILTVILSRMPQISPGSPMRAEFLSHNTTGRAAWSAFRRRWTACLSS